MLRKLSLGLILLICCSSAGSGNVLDAPLLWLSQDPAPENSHAAFRAAFHLPEDGVVDFRLSGASWYVVWLDGTYFYEGPDRYAPAYPEYQTKKATLPKGDHLVAVQVHNLGIQTRILDAIQPFLFCSILQQGREVPLSWKCAPLTGYEHVNRRINAELGWVEWADTQKLPYKWQTRDFDDAAWKTPVAVKRDLGTFAPSQIGNVKAIEITPILMAEGRLAEVYGYELDNPSARFFLRDLVCDKLPPQGVWRRYDLGRVRLARPRFVLDLPAGATVEFAYSESLSHDRVSPWITLSDSDSCNLDHFVARGGPQEFFPLHPKGGRFAEVHVLAPASRVRFVKESFVERTYYEQPEGDFRCDDDLLNRIWKTGIETYRACAEDALIDNPTRERGQWIGDMGVGGMQIGSAAFSDIRICRRALVQSAQCAREDGMVAGLCPGGENYLSSFAAQWVPACLNYYRLTGDKSLLEELYPAAEKDIAAFQRYSTEWGIGSRAGWAFIDWGYVPNVEPADMGLNLHYLLALRGMVQWSSVLHRDDRVGEYRTREAQMSEILQKWFRTYTRAGSFEWDRIGYHRTVLGMLAGLIPPEQHRRAIEAIKGHILSCFPNDPRAPRLSSPRLKESQLVTPYFANFAFPLLIDHGEIDFVLDQYRRSWGWALEDGRTTWVEVFDTRWSHCHEWAGCPTWQLSRYVLGLLPRFDLKPGQFDLVLRTGQLASAAGKIPLPDGKTVRVSWRKAGAGIDYEISTDEPITVRIPAGVRASHSGSVPVTDKLKISISNGIR